jgi:hypothetical protein
MKMPRRPFFLGTIKPRPDIFGLHHVSLLAQTCESEADKQKRTATVEKGVTVSAPIVRQGPRLWVYYGGL